MMTEDCNDLVRALMGEEPSYDDLVCSPDYMATLRAIPVGGVRHYEMIGRLYPSMMTARTRLQAEGKGRYEFEADRENNCLTVRRIA
ncbi:hypothetical protein [uncultured Alistipes sp.]|uniref:hypothetical protein n=1 Tax=uncultured Alistipes sp. TaxID=538949 RepID=UPI0026267E97|nr:hypothetical protein [uncultured Alistipes sp.]